MLNGFTKNYSVFPEFKLKSWVHQNRNYKMWFERQKVFYSHMKPFITPNKQGRSLLMILQKWKSKWTIKSWKSGMDEPKIFFDSRFENP